jgi:hypothetical protein
MWRFLTYKLDKHCAWSDRTPSIEKYMANKINVHMVLVQVLKRYPNIYYIQNSLLVSVPREAGLQSCLRKGWLWTRTKRWDYSYFAAINLSTDFH